MADLLTKLSIISSIIGIILLIIISDKIIIPKSSLGSINNSDIGKSVTIEGTATDVKHKGDSITALELENKDKKISVIAFNSKEFYIKEGEYLEISGKISVYNNNLQIIAEKIRK